MQSISDIRREYNKAGLDTDSLTANPLDLFDIWLQNAVDAKLDDPTAMTVATVDSSGQPSQRIVLLKDVNQGGFIFYTNLGSKKASDLKQNNKISLHFPWHMLERQVKVCGTAQPLSVAEVTKYFFSRPKPSQVAAWVSQQSHPIATKQLLMSQFHAAKQKFLQGEVPFPSLWGGYRVIPHEIEFWQGGEHRMHDRFLYKLDHNQQWQHQRLMP
ncbi:pyridoxamine 5'-phosphate oxidase [Paraglaciecola hydrolytica]|uniref:Pyridoxine/pyridoxamine 5'-phosphate oxidase n=1 Tax=Paraglaciecola hydrolytica TaxID=1799789 RepID=A0A136A0F6_9ALTE|nr:pyridoxamine 5'-phosphate oxidase [Paraglaciecola hydrolytica]KXI28694.1 pyridoxine 5'-phosphate oxidase [Paraglaciecola hydrolytica]